MRFPTIAILLLSVTLECAAGASLAAEKGTVRAPDGIVYLISKDLADGRWAIGLDTSTGIATGNVFPPDGSAPKFLWCSSSKVELDPDPAKTFYDLDCFTAPACTAAPCATPVWTYVGAAVRISGDFFFTP